MTKVRTLTKAITPNNTRLFFIALVGLCVLSAIFYVYAVNQIVRTGVRLQATESELGRVTAKLSEMEFLYINQKNSITLDKAIIMGFTQAEPTKFVSRKSTVALAHIADNAR